MHNATTPEMSESWVGAWTDHGAPVGSRGAEWGRSVAITPLVGHHRIHIYS